jgi:hypothetical protein
LRAPCGTRTRRLQVEGLARLTVFSNGACSRVRRPRLELGIVPLGGDRVFRYASGVWSGTQESNLAIPLYQSGPVDQLGRARERKVEVSSLAA